MFLDAFTPRQQQISIPPLGLHATGGTDTPYAWVTQWVTAVALQKLNIVPEEKNMVESHE